MTRAENSSMNANLALISVVGAVFLLLYGMRVAGEALQRVAGQRLRVLLYNVGKHPLAALGVGAAVTALMQSSSATTIMLVGFARAGLIELRQALGLILGADVGTTLTVQLLAFKVYDYAFLLVAVGGALFLTSRRRVPKDIGLAMLGFGLVLLSLKTLIEAMAPLGENDLMRQIFVDLEEAPILAMLLAAIFAAITTSSTATIGIALILAGEGVLTLPAAIPMVLGANVGTTAAAFVSSFGGSPEARQVATAHGLFKVVGALIFLPLAAPFAALVAMTSSEPAREVANAHTLFNLSLAILFLPFTEQVARVLVALVPPQAGEERFRPKYLDEYALESPALALGQATREALRMADIVQEMFRDTLTVFRDNDETAMEQIAKREDQVDYLEEEIKSYLTQLSQHSLTEEQSKREVGLIYLINELEHIGDIIDKSTMSLAKQKIDGRLTFSSQGMAELEELHHKVAENLQSVVTSVATRDVELAQGVLAGKAAINKMERDLRQAHIRRLHAGLRESIETSSIHMDVLNDVKRINSHVTNMAYVVLGEL